MLHPTRWLTRKVTEISPAARHALFAAPAVAVVVIGLAYLAFSWTVCDPLYAATGEAAGHSRGSALAALEALRVERPPLAADAPPVPTVSFGPYCGSGQ